MSRDSRQESPSLGTGGVNTATTTQNTIHRAERLLCGCSVDPISGARFITCPAHTKLPVEPLAKKDGMRGLCPYCASQRIVPLQGTAVGTHFCVDCHCQFFDSEITGYGLSVDSKPRLCPHCGTVEYNVCSCTQRREFA